MLKIVYIKRYDNRTFNDTTVISRNTNQYTTDVAINYNINKVPNITKSYYKFIDDVVINTHDNIHTNGNINVTKTNKLDISNDNNYLQRK